MGGKGGKKGRKKGGGEVRPLKPADQKLTHSLDMIAAFAALKVCPAPPPAGQGLASGMWELKCGVEPWGIQLSLLWNDAGIVSDRNLDEAAGRTQELGVGGWGFGASPVKGCRPCQRLDPG